MLRTQAKEEEKGIKMKENRAKEKRKEDDKRRAEIMEGTVGDKKERNTAASVMIKVVKNRRKLVQIPVYP